MKNLKTIFHFIIEDESGQGMTEYILLVVVIVALVMIFRTNIMQAVQTQIQSLSTQITSFTGNPSGG